MDVGVEFFCNELDDLVLEAFKPLIRERQIIWVGAHSDLTSGYFGSNQKHQRGDNNYMRITEGKRHRGSLP